MLKSSAQAIGFISKVCTFKRLKVSTFRLSRSTFQAANFPAFQHANVSSCQLAFPASRGNRETLEGASCPKGLHESSPLQFIPKFSLPRPQSSQRLTRFHWGSKLFRSKSFALLSRVFQFSWIEFRVFLCVLCALCGSTTLFGFKAQIGKGVPGKPPGNKRRKVGLQEPDRQTIAG